MMKLIKENFKDLEQQVKKIREWEDKELTNDFVVDAYVLAKMIQEKYNYDIKPEKILSEFGINVTFQESSEGVSSDYCSVTLENESQINILIKYYIDRESFNKLNRLYPSKKAIYLEFGFGLDEIEFGVYHNTKYFYSLYALVYIIVSKQYENIEYSIWRKQNKEKEIIEKISLLLLYIEYDFYYRKERWLIAGDRSKRHFPNNHPIFYNIESELIRFADSMIEKYYPTSSFYLSTSSDAFKPNMSNKVICEMLKVISILEKMEEYEKISQMLCPLDYFEKHKIESYETFGEPIIFD